MEDVNNTKLNDIHQHFQKELEEHLADLNARLKDKLREMEANLRTNLVRGLDGELTSRLLTLESRIGDIEQLGAQAKHPQPDIARRSVDSVNITDEFLHTLLSRILPIIRDLVSSAVVPACE